MESIELGVNPKSAICGGMVLFMSWFSVVPVSAEVVISEIMATRGNPLLDVDLDRSDWIELFNTGTESVALGGWTLSDQEESEDAWELPDISLDAGAFRVIFASGKDCRDPEGELHTNFKLRRSGEYLELRDPTGVVRSSFHPEFPRQHDAHSYGPAMNTVRVPVITAASVVRYHVPSADDDTSVWQQSSFDDSGWLRGQGSLGYEASNPPRLLPLIDSDFSEVVFRKGASVYARYRIEVLSPEDTLRLHLRYDDGVVVYLNGRQVLRRNAPSRLDYLSRAPRSREIEEVLQEETIGFGGQDGLRTGENVLAFHLLNNRSSDREFLLSVRAETVRLPDTQLGEHRYFSEPTPGSPNVGGSQNLWAAPEASLQSGVYSGTQNVTLSSPSPQVEIRYTVDGSIPSLESPVYESPLLIESATILRATAFSNDGKGGQVGVWHYLIGDDEVQSFNSNLPVVVVDMLGGNVSSASANPALLQIYDVDEGGRSSFFQAPELSEQAVVKIRGSSTEGRPKRAFNVELRDAFGEDLDREVLGMPSESDWILYAPYNFDRALIRNAFMYAVSNQMGMYAVRTRFCEVYVNSRRGRNLSQSSYAGVYVLMEKIKRGSDRVPVEKLLSKHTEVPDVSGGYILKIDRLDPGDSGFSGGGQGMAHVYPKEENRTAAQLSFLRDHFNAFNRALRGSAPTDPNRGYPRYIDVNSFVDFHMLNEFSKNPDGLRLSTYMHIPRNGKLTMGPIWDFDRTMGPDDDSRAANPIGRSSVYNFSWWGRLFQVPDFQQLYADRWHMWRDRVMTEENLMAIIDGMAEELTEAQERNFDRWNLVSGTAGWRREISQLKTWVRRRLEWFDTEFVPRPVPSLNPGVVDAGTVIEFGESDAEIYFTLDGTDPRAPAGGVSQSALLFSPENPIVIDESLLLSARARMEGRRDVLWSSPFEGHYLMSILPRLAISEIMYHPAVHDSGGPWSESDFEFIEIQSLSSEPVNLVGIRITGGIRFDIPNRILAPGDTALVVGNRQAFLKKYPELLSRVVGEFEGDLSNRGEAIRIEDVHGRLIFHVDYEDRGDWYSVTDGEGFSLEWNGQILEATAASSWKVSSRSGGSPGWVEVDSLVVKDLKVSGKRIEMTVEGNFVGSVAVQRSASIDATSWDTVGEIHLGAGMNSVEFSEPVRAGSYFYRVLEIERDQQ